MKTDYSEHPTLKQEFDIESLLDDPVYGEVNNFIYNRLIGSEGVKQIANSFHTERNTIITRLFNSAYRIMWEISISNCPQAEIEDYLTQAAINAATSEMTIQKLTKNVYLRKAAYYTLGIVYYLLDIHSEPKYKRTQSSLLAYSDNSQFGNSADYDTIVKELTIEAQSHIWEDIRDRLLDKIQNAKRTIEILKKEESNYEVANNTSNNTMTEIKTNKDTKTESAINTNQNMESTIPPVIVKENQQNGYSSDAPLIKDENNTIDDSYTVIFERKDNKNKIQTKRITAQEIANIVNKSGYTNGMTKPHMMNVLSLITGISASSFKNFLNESVDYQLEDL